MMKEASDKAMEVDVDMEGTSDNIDMGPSTQANENASKKLQLAELPKEMLEEILTHLDDKNLLNASHVCKLFASVAEMAFARKYSKKSYNINCDEHLNKIPKSFHKVMLNKYGGKMRMIGIEYCKDEEILELVEQKCDNAKSLSLCNVSKMVMLNGLKEAYLIALLDVKQETITEFINMNPQLETLISALFDTDSLAIGRLNNLKSLQIDVGNTADCVRRIKALTCNHIKKLTLMNHNGSNEDDADADLVDHFINEVCKFNALVSLVLWFHRFTSDQVKKLVTDLPHLTEFSVDLADGDSEAVQKILSTTSMLPKLTKLTIRLDKDDFDGISNELKNSANDFHARFAKSKFEMNLANASNVMSITTDYLFLSQERSVELHWMDNLNEKNVRKVLNSVFSAKEIKFVNNCADRTFDISALSYIDKAWQIIFVHTKCLDFKSNGPISVNSNVSRFHTLFPQLKILKIHLEQHSANDFLRNLEANFCEHIEELWLNTKGDTADPDMPNVLAKFGNLKSLYLGPSPIKFDLRHLFQACPNLTKIKHPRVLFLNERQ